MPTYLLYGGAGLAALLGFMLLRKPAPAATASTPQTASTYPMAYGTGFGVNSIPASGGLINGGTSDNSAASIMAAAFATKSANDLQLGLAQADTTKSLGLASIAANLQADLTTLGNARLHDVFANVPVLAKNGVSGVFSSVDTAGNVSSNQLYTDNTKNASLVTGYNAKGDLMTLDNTIQSQAPATATTPTVTTVYTTPAPAPQTSSYNGFDPSWFANGGFGSSSSYNGSPF
jgi:hypothetical protein